MGFGAGLVADLVLPTPFGLSALVGCLLGFTVGITTLALDRTAWWLPPVAAFGASALYEVIFAVLGSVLGQPQMIHVDLTRWSSWCRWSMPSWPSRPSAWWAGPSRRPPPRACPPRRSPPGHCGERRGGPRTKTIGALGYWCAVSRSLRHPFRGSHHYLRAEKDRGPRRKKPRQPRMRQSRFSMESMLDAPDTSASRPGLRLRIAGLVVAGLFALLGLRLWALTVLQAPAAAQAVSVNQIRDVPVEPTRGLILDRSGNPLVSNVVVQQITLSRSAAQEHPEVIGRLATLIGKTTQQVQAIIADPRYSPYKPVPVLTGGTSPAAQNQILSDILYISEHQDDFPGVASVQTTERTYPQGELPGPAQDNYPATQTLGYVGDHQQHRAPGRRVQGLPGRRRLSGSPASSTSTSRTLRGTPGTQEIEVTPSGKVAGTVKTTPATPGDNLVTNIDTNLQQVADNALAAQILSLRQDLRQAVQQQLGVLPRGHRRRGDRDEPPDRGGLRHVVVPDLQPLRVGGRAQRRPEHPAVRSGQR